MVVTSLLASRYPVLLLASAATATPAGRYNGRLRGANHCDTMPVMSSLPIWLTWDHFDGLLTALGTIALALYAAVEVREGRRDRLERKTTARRERRDREAAALATLRGEHVRLSRLKARWAGADLAPLIAAGAINELDLVPPDWRGVTVAIGVLGGKTSILAAIAYGALADAALQIRIANIGRRLRLQMESGGNSSNSDQRVALLPADQLVAELQQWVADAVDVLQEAIWHAPGGRENVIFDDSSIVTEGARRLIGQLAQDVSPEVHHAQARPEHPT
jgi:hypothetical protein